MARSGLSRGDAQVASIRQQIRREARHHLETSDHRVLICATALAPSADRRLTAAAHRVEMALARVDASDPTRLIARGWSITHRADGRPVRSIGGLLTGDELMTRLADGMVRSTVTNTDSIGDHP
jgi:exodeoxyribonuclease VII large subunit